MKQETENHTAKCPNCLSTNVYGMSRVVGYYSIIENWNDSKKAELQDRQKGSYKLANSSKIEVLEEQHLEAPIKISTNGCC
jgi:hypothetical protein